jgi:hypothetical protein
MLDKLADAHPFARGAELLFRSFKGRDGRGGAVRAVEVPCEEAGEVLQGAEDFVTADWGG